LLEVRDLTVRFFTYDGVLKALEGVNFFIRDREIFGVVGETGCGKSVTAKAILRLIPDPPGRITAGEVVFQGVNLLDSIEDEAHIRISDKGRARIRRNRRIERRMEALMRTIRGNDISMIFQEPSAALNPVISVEEQIGETFFTHQVGEICDAAEKSHKLSFLHRHFFKLLRAREKRSRRVELAFRELSIKRSLLRAADAAGDLGTVTSLRGEVEPLERELFRLTSFRLPRWLVAAMGVATLGLGLVVLAVARRVLSLDSRIAFWQRFPVLGPRYLMVPVRREIRRRVIEMLKQVNIADPEKKADAYPFELSGGMQQRVMIAMALACRPRLLLADEPTTALDVTIQAQILSLIRQLRDSFGSSIMLITHDLGVVAETCDRVGVMYAGVMAEVGTASDIFNGPRHPYTVGLMRSIPETYARTGRLSIIPGSVPSLLTPPEGCRFHPRCPFASASCKRVVPVLSEVEPGHAVACHLYDHPEFFPPETVAARDRGLGGAWEQVVKV
jgi:peptide/nickel transport system ATP-binding protein